MRRTQLYIDGKALDKLKKLSTARKTTVSALVRDAIEQTYFVNEPPANWRQILEESIGSWKDRSELPETATYIRELRKDSRRRTSG